jgi:trehalose 6-phosphate phosphatase
MKPPETGNGPAGPDQAGGPVLAGVPPEFTPRTAAGRAGLAALLAHPGGALIALDFDGTLAPIVEEPAAARAHPDAVAALRRLAGQVGSVAIITGRRAAFAAERGGLAGVPGLIVFGHYGWERWADGEVTLLPAPPGVAAARQRLPGVLAAAGAPPGTWTEDKGHAVAVHTRRTADPAAALRLLRQPVEELAAQEGLLAQPGRLVIELRPGGMDKGKALKSFISERASRVVLFCGDDLGDIPAFTAVADLRGDGIPGVAVCSGSAEVPELAAASDLVVDGPAGVAALLNWLAERLGSPA